MGRGGPGSLAPVFCEVGRGDSKSLLHEEHVVVSPPELGVPDSGYLYEERGEVPSAHTLKVDEVLDVLKSAPFARTCLEVTEVVLVLRVEIAGVLVGIVHDHPLVLLESTQRGVDSAGPAGLVLQVRDEAGVSDLCQCLVGDRQGGYLGGHEELDCTGVPSVLPQLRHCLLYTSPSPRDRTRSRMPSSA